MNKTCHSCSQKFELDENDQKVFDRFNVPEPALCRDCRHQRRLLFRNDRNLYQRTCDLCKKPMISIYSSGKKYTVYCSECWWSDKWDSAQYGRKFDFNKPFFEQFESLMREAPLLGNMVFNSTNCEYNGGCVNSKDCYLSARVGDSEGILYSYLSLKSLKCIDGYNNYDCQYCYECVDCWNCYEAGFSQLCRNTSQSAFCYDCIGCSNCFGCTGLRNAQYYIFNKKYSKEEYLRQIRQWSASSYENIQRAWKKFQEELANYPRRANIILHSQNAAGDYIMDSKDIFQCFDIEKTDTARNSWGVEYSRDIYDCDFIYYGENCYEVIGNSKSTNIQSSFMMMSAYDMKYSMMCFNNTHNCFGCISLKQKKYCILNKEYEKEEYEKFMQKITAHMKKTGEYGEFFPPNLSPFGYNETVANDFFPLTKDEALRKGFHWKEKDQKEYQKQTYQVPDNISSVQDNILKEILVCGECGKNYRIIPQELAAYRLARIAIPRKCPLCRHRDRMKLRNPRKLWTRSCAKCKTRIETSCAPDRPEKIYCEKCYLEGIY